MPKKKILSLAEQKAAEIDQLLEAFEELVDKNASLLTKSLIDGFLDKLDATNGAILNTAQNLKKVELIDKAFFKFQDQQGMGILSHLMADMEAIMKLNANYFKELNGGRMIQDSDIRKVIHDRLGISAEGELIRDGYMMGLLDDPQVRNEIKQFAYQRMIGGAGFQDFRAGLKSLVEGDPDRLGIFKRFYRNYAFDTYSQADATNGALYAKKLGLKYFIYNGGIMRDKKGKVRSRAFCVKRAGKVFSTQEAEKWKTDKDLTAVDSKATYVWQTQRGGFACRHSIDYISEELAFELRPELAGAEAAPEEPEAAPAVKQAPSFPGVEKASKIMDGARIHMTGQQSEALRRYTSSTYEIINGHWRQTTVLKGSMAQDIEQVSEKLSEWLQQAPKFKHDKLYRGARFREGDPNYKPFVSQLKKGNIFSDPGYMSTSIDAKVSQGTYGGSSGGSRYVQFEIQEAEGVFLNGLSEFPNEAEVLFDRGTPFEITDVFTDPDYPNITRVKMRLVNTK